MGKYDRLSEHLAAWPTDEWRASFAEVEKVLGSALPKTARTGRAWWANDPEKSHSGAWAAQGWEVGDVDHAADRLVGRGCRLARRVRRGRRRKGAGPGPVRSQDVVGDFPGVARQAQAVVDRRRGGVGCLVDDLRPGRPVVAAQVWPHQRAQTKPRNQS